MKRRWKSTARRQIRFLVSLLAVWPSIPVRVADKASQDVLGVRLTRACLQEAKRILGLRDPQHAEETKKKIAYARYCTANCIQQYGLGLDRKKLYFMVRSSVEGYFKHTIHQVLLARIVRDTQAAMSAYPDPEEYLQVCREELAAIGIDPDHRIGDLI